MTDTHDISVAGHVPHATLNGRPKNLQIQWLRFLAALMVLLHHASVYQIALLHRTGFALFTDGRLAVMGVSIFFAVSGYLMAVALQAQTPSVFLAHRLIRIYPPFLLVVGLYFLAASVTGHPFPLDPVALTLAPVGTAGYPLHVEWTLVFELTFYVALFAVGTLRLAGQLPRIALIWLAILALRSMLRSDSEVPSYTLDRILLVSANIPMAGGLLIPSLLRWKPHSWLLIAAGASTWFLYTLWPQTLNDSRWLFGTGATLLVAGSVALSRSRPGFGDNRAGHLFARLGDYSYALYLCHVPVLYCLYLGLAGMAPDMLWLIAVAAALLAAAVIGPLDIFLYRRLKAMTGRIAPTAMKVVAGLYVAAFLGIALLAVFHAHRAALAAGRGQALAERMQAAGRIDDAETAIEAARQMGLSPATGVDGAVDAITWQGGALTLNGWSVDTGRPATPVSILLFQDGHLLGSAVTSLPRPDVALALHVVSQTGFAFTARVNCAPGKPIVAVQVTQAGAFAVLPPLSVAEICR